MFFVNFIRVGEMLLPHSLVDTPVFMPVGTQGTMKGLTPEQLGKDNKPASQNSHFCVAVGLYSSGIVLDLLPGSRSVSYQIY